MGCARALGSVHTRKRPAKSNKAREKNLRLSLRPQVEIFVLEEMMG